MIATASGVPKRIAIVAPSLAGVLRDRANLIRGLKERGHTILVVAPSQLAGEVAALHHMGAEHRTFEPRPPGMALFARRRVMQSVRDIFQAWTVETVVVSGPDLATIAAVAARKAGAKRIVCIVAADVGSGFEDQRSALMTKVRQAVKMSEAVVCHNEADARALKALLHSSDKPLVMSAGDGVDLKAFPVLPLPTGPGVTFLMIANPDARDAIEAYTAAARSVSAKFPDARFELATDRETAHDTTLFTVDGLAFHGRAADAHKLLAQAHVAVQLSVDDGSPTALKQALAAGRPVVTLDVPGCREMVDERINGCLVPAGSPESLVTALESFLVHRDLIPAEARAARAKAEHALGFERVLEPVLAVIEG